MIYCYVIIKKYVTKKFVLRVVGILIVETKQIDDFYCRYLNAILGNKAILVKKKSQEEKTNISF